MSRRSTGHADTEDNLHPDFSHTSHEQSPLLGPEQIHSSRSREDEDRDHAREVSSWKNLPWWKRPSPYWLIFGTLFGSIGFAALLAPKVALYSALACRVHRPEYFANNDSLFPFPSTVSIYPAGALIPHVSDGNHTRNGLDPEQKCASDPVVQAVVARLNAVFAISMGILSCLTAGSWGSLSDRYGRRTVLFVSVFGLFVTECTHVITAWFVDVLPGGYWFPVVGFLFEGLCGSMPSGVAIAHAYVADTTNPSTRSRYFSLALGLMFTGIAVGPALGGLLIRSTGTILSVFYFSSILHGAYAIFVLLVLPESLTRTRIRGARLRWAHENANQLSSGRTLDVLKSATRSLSPLVVLLPKQPLDGNSLKPRRRDWNLFLTALAYGLVTSAMGSYSYKLQYAAAQFNWTPEITSYYVSINGITRTLFLTVVLPLIIKYFKPALIRLPSTPDDPPRSAVSLSPSRGASLAPSSAEINAPGQRFPVAGFPAFDLALARASVGLESTAFLGMAVASTGTLFASASAIGSFAAGFSPATQALALDIYTNHRSRDQEEIGKLFGALSVIQALGSQIISPALYGFVYFNTVARFPQAIMVVSACLSLLALTFLLFVHIPSRPTDDGISPEHGNEEGRQNAGTPEILLATENEVAEGR